MQIETFIDVLTDVLVESMRLCIDYMQMEAFIDVLTF